GAPCRELVRAALVGERGQPLAVRLGAGGGVGAAYPGDCLVLVHGDLRWGAGCPYPSCVASPPVLASPAVAGWSPCRRPCTPPPSPCSSRGGRPHRARSSC